MGEKRNKAVMKFIFLKEYASWERPDPFDQEVSFASSVESPLHATRRQENIFVLPFL
jgi:hypothetical protein